MVKKDGMDFRSRGSWKKEEEQHPTGGRRFASPSPVRAGVGWEQGMRIFQMSASVFFHPHSNLKWPFAKMWSGFKVRRSRFG